MDKSTRKNIIKKTMKEKRKLKHFLVDKGDKLIARKINRNSPCRCGSGLKSKIEGVPILFFHYFTIPEIDQIIAKLNEVKEFLI